MQEIAKIPQKQVAMMLRIIPVVAIPLATPVAAADFLRPMLPNTIPTMESARKKNA